jgi:hypothetical protein
MRKAMICVSFMLVLLQVWPMLFGHRAGEATAAISAEESAPRLIAAVATTKAIPIPAAVSVPGNGAPMSCYKHYKAVFAGCSKGDQTCHIKAADAWDLCEATGFWPK